MGRIVQFRGDPHEEAQRLMPWYANGALDPEEWRVVDAHLAGCAECQADLEMEHTLRAEVSTIEMGAVRNFAILRARIDAHDAVEPKTANEVRSVFRRPVALGWALCAQAAMLVLVTGIVELPRHDGPVLYRTLGSAPAAVSGNLLVVFEPNTVERHIRVLLNDVDARVVDGPSLAGVWVLRVPADGRPKALAKLRGDPLVRLAERVDAGADP